MPVDPTLGILGVLMEPTAVVAKAGITSTGCGGWKEQAPQSVLITGPGPIGQLGALLGKQRGLDVHVYDHNKTGIKPEITAALGATYHCESVEEALEKLQPGASSSSAQACRPSSLGCCRRSRRTRSSA